jgi:hypothetical protein
MMKALWTLMMIGVVATFVGCNQQTPGGPGVTGTTTSNTGTSTTTTTTANKPIYGEAAGTFDVNAPSLATRVTQGETQTATVSLSRGKDFNEDVAISVTDLPEGVTVEPANPMIKHDEKETTLTFHAAPEAAVGEFTAKVMAHPTKGADATSTMKVTVLKKK